MKKYLSLILLGFCALNSNAQEIVTPSLPDSLPAVTLEAEYAKPYSASYDTSLYLISALVSGMSVSPGISIEGTFGQYLSVGGVYNNYWGDFKGFKISLQARAYPFGRSPNGVFVQGTVGTGLVSHNFGNTYTGKAIYPESDTKTFNPWVAGIGLGYRCLFGKEHRWSSDISVHYQVTSFDRNKLLKVYPETFPASYANSQIDHRSKWDNLGPAALIVPQVSLGYLIVR